MRCRDFLLDLGCRFFELRGELDVAVVLHARAGGDQAADDDVFLEAAERVDRAVDAGFGEDAGGLLEARRRDEAVGGERRLGDAEQQRTADGRTAAFHQHALVFGVEAEAVDLLLEQEVGVADLFDLHPTEHLADDRFDVLVRDGHALETIDLLDFVDEVHLQLALAEDLEDVVRVAGTVDECIAGTQALAFLHVDVDAARNAVLLFLAVVRGDVDLALTLGDIAEANDAIDLGDDRRIAGLAGLEEFDHARQTAGDVLGTGGFARDLGEDVAGGDFVAVLHHEVSAGGHEVTLVALRGLDDDGRLTLLVGGVGDDEAREAGDFVDLFVERDAFLQVLELDRAGDLREDGEGVGVPLAESVAELDLPDRLPRVSLAP